MTTISDSEARAALRHEKSEASNPAYFAARRREGGWVFGWREDCGQPPMGTHTWIVADNSRVRMLGFSELYDDVLAQEMVK